MIWQDDMSFKGWSKRKSEWFDDPNHFIGDPPVSAQYALNLIFKTLVDDKEHYPYLTTFPESIEQTNSNLFCKNTVKIIESILRKRGIKMICDFYEIFKPTPKEKLNLNPKFERVV